MKLLNDSYNDYYAISVGTKHKNLPLLTLLTKVNCQLLNTEYKAMENRFCFCSCDGFNFNRRHRLCYLSNFYSLASNNRLADRLRRGRLALNKNLV